MLLRQLCLIVLALSIYKQESHGAESLVKIRQVAITKIATCLLIIIVARLPDFIMPLYFYLRSYLSYNLISWINQEIYHAIAGIDVRWLQLS